jgi:hypothetical protein
MAIENKINNSEKIGSSVIQKSDSSSSIIKMKRHSYSKSRIIADDSPSELHAEPDYIAIPSASP